MPRSYHKSSEEFADQWIRPNDIFSVLLILGGDVIQLACAAMAGGTSIPPNPVTFSFGWVAYAVSALLSAIGENRLITCQPEVPLLVINLDSGYRRSNRSWLLGRLVKTYEYWMPDEVRDKVNPSAQKRRGDTEQNHDPTPPVLTSAGHLSALCIAVYEWREDLEAAAPRRDLAWWSGYFVSLIQLVVAVIPLSLFGDWAILLATVAGTMLSYSSASLPQWREEKWKARKSNKAKPVALTEGNGALHVIIINGIENMPDNSLETKPNGDIVNKPIDGVKDMLDLEDLAAGRASVMPSTRYLTLALSILWLVLLVTCTGIQSHTWYLLAVGGIGILHNIIVAAVPRQPEAMGIPIRLKETKSSGKEIYAEFKVMWSLMELESKHKGWGKALRDEFFPGQLREDEKTWWDCDAENGKDTRKTILDKLRADYKSGKKGGSEQQGTGGGKDRGRREDEGKERKSGEARGLAQASQVHPSCLNEIPLVAT
ncbi:hypothetical protein TGAMA5MH_06814 [Trichoderma gamsii]|uniref:Uncharacterized protein n=1 Tax=Trichoderma gamsii TaxID=398673 RepID=A0A2K0T5Z6_9HYPO|nr:hypothetical protein TGAMA5MH_06814 [Trichoderma gamsii]